MEDLAVDSHLGQDGFASGNNHLYIHRGYIYTDANGDGMDINRSIEMTGGTAIINALIRNDNRRVLVTCYMRWLIIRE